MSAAAHARGEHRHLFRRIWPALGIALVLTAADVQTTRADDITAIYQAFWAGLPAAEIRLKFHDGDAGYHDEIEIRTKGLASLLTRFRATALVDGRLDVARLAEPSRYLAVYDLRKRLDRHVSLLFASRAGAAIAERGSDDTSRKPPLAEDFRRNAVDPLTALERIRRALRARSFGGENPFVIPVYDGARRFDVIGRVPPSKEAMPNLKRVELTLRPIAGFKGQTSEDGDPDDAPRPVELLVTNDARILPLSLKVSMFFMPLIVQFDRLCTMSEPCPG